MFRHLPDRVDKYIANTYYRKRYFGWFLFSITFFLLIHIILGIYIFIAAIYEMPVWISGVLLLSCCGSLSPVIYFATRTFGEEKTVSDVLSSSYSKTEFFLILLIIGLIVLMNVGYWILNVGESTVVVISTVLFGVFYFIAGISGHKHAKVRMAIDRYDGLMDTKTEATIHEYEMLLDRLQIKSDRNATLVGLFIIISSFMTWYFYDFGTALGVFVGIPSFIQAVLFFRPSGE